MGLTSGRRHDRSQMCCCSPRLLPYVSKANRPCALHRARTPCGTTAGARAIDPGSHQRGRPSCCDAAKADRKYRAQPAKKEQVSARCLRFEIDPTSSVGNSRQAMRTPEHQRASLSGYLSSAAPVTQQSRDERRAAVQPQLRPVVRASRRAVKPSRRGKSMQ